MNETKQRIVSNRKTTIIGIPVLLYAVFMVTTKVLCAFKIPVDCSYSVQDILITFTLGYSFTLAKDTLIEGLSLGLFKKKS